MHFKRLNLKVILYFFIISLTANCVSVKEINTDLLRYSEIYENFNWSKSKFFEKTNKWILDTFNSPKEAIQYSDKKEGIIKLNFTIRDFDSPRYEFGYMQSPTADFSITIQIKDSKAKITVNAISAIRATDQGFLNLKDTILKILQGFEESLKKEDESW